MSQLTRYNTFINHLLVTPDDDKGMQIMQHIKRMLNKTSSMFKWNNLPDTITARYLELLLQINGFAVFYRYDGNLYVFDAGLGGEPNYEYMPTIAVITNPYLRLNVAANIGTDCVVMPNDATYNGIYDICNEYATDIVETEISLRLAAINTRVVALISAQDERTRESAIKYIESIKSGKECVIADSPFLDGIKSQPIFSGSHANMFQGLIELDQYFRANWYHELGLNANYNMKRERLNTAEVNTNYDCLLPLIDDMLKQRQIFAQKVNDMFGTDISVELASSWKLMQENVTELDASDSAITDVIDENENKITQDIESEDSVDMSIKDVIDVVDNILTTVLNDKENEYEQYSDEPTME